jgi:peptide/nickel transport system permease protein
MSIGAVPIESAAALSAGRRQVRGEVVNQVVRSPLFLIGAVILLWWIVCALFGSQIAPDNPYAQSLLNINKAPSGAHLFGTDQLGRDVFSRVIVGARDILIVAPLATVLGTVLGTAIGLTMGYFRGIADDVIGRFVEAFLALPVVVTAIIATFALGRSNVTLILVIGVLFTPLIARTVRAAVLSERELDYVAAARLRGEKAPYVMFVEILPNVMGPVVVEFTVRLGYAIFAIATLSFLGFGIPPPAPDWGLSIAEQYTYLISNLWWPALFPALAIASLVIAVNLFADGLSTVLER